MRESEISPEMHLFSPDGSRLYLNAQKRKRFLKAAKQEAPENQMFCQVLHYTGCRPTEALEQTPGRILMEEQSLVFRSLKKRKTDYRGRTKQPQYRTVPIPQPLIDGLDLVFGVRTLRKRKKQMDDPLWDMSRATAYRMVKRVMERAVITGKQALPPHVLSQLMGHSDSKITEIYLQVVGEEKRQLVADAWEG